jgi:hypothetical protein
MAGSGVASGAYIGAAIVFLRNPKQVNLSDYGRTIVCQLRQQRYWIQLIQRQGACDPSVRG